MASHCVTNSLCFIKGTIYSAHNLGKTYSHHPMERSLHVAMYPDGLLANTYLHMMSCSPCITTQRSRYVPSYQLHEIGYVFETSSSKEIMKDNEITDKNYFHSTSMGNERIRSWNMPTFKTFQSFFL